MPQHTLSDSSPSDTIQTTHGNRARLRATRVVAFQHAVHQHPYGLPWSLDPWFSGPLPSCLGSHRCWTFPLLPGQSMNQNPEMRPSMVTDNRRRQVRKRTHAYISKCSIYTCTYVYIYTCVYIYMYMHMHVFQHIRIATQRAYVHMYTHTCLKNVARLATWKLGVT